MGASRGTPEVRLDRGAWQSIRDATLLASPLEACGSLGGTFEPTVSPAGEFVVRSATSLANESENDRRCHFFVPPARVREAAERLERDGSSLIGFFHSHPNGGPDPSGEDVGRAWPGQLHLITSLERTGIVQVRAFEVDLVVGEPRERSVTLVDGRSSSLRGFSPGTDEVESCRE